WDDWGSADTKKSGVGAPSPVSSFGASPVSAFGSPVLGSGVDKEEEKRLKREKLAHLREQKKAALAAKKMGMNKLTIMGWGDNKKRNNSNNNRNSSNRNAKHARNNKNKGKKEDTWDHTKSRSGYTDVVMYNELFEKYYKAQGIIAEEEWELFYKYLRTPLPSNYRITGSRSVSAALKQTMIDNFLPDLQNIEVDGEKIPAPFPLAWYPNGLAWQYDAPRTAIRKLPELARFHKFLVAETEIGNISRQEAVSMIPPLFLDVQPHHYVLDMCAAPGSKTAQLVESLHAGVEDGLPSGMVVANDVDYQRSYMLNDENTKVLQFDRILCDAPCSGDGTLRKNKPIWARWNVNSGNNLHRLQTAILRRGCELLKVGGRMVYSTCTFNPVENEAVVAYVLNQSKGALRLVNVSTTLPALTRRAGINTWSVMDPAGNIYNSHSDLPESLQSKIVPSCFPPENASELGLENCMRVLPFEGNCGGFFVSVLEKVSPFGGLDGGKGKVDKEEEEEVVVEGLEGLEKLEGMEADVGDVVVEKQSKEEKEEKKGADKDADGNPNKKMKAAWQGAEDPFIFLPEDHEDVKNIIDFFGIKPTFPRSQYVVRSEVSANRTIYFVGSSVKELLMAENSRRLKIVNTGIKIFTRNSGSITKDVFPYRLSSESLPTLQPHLENLRIVDATFNDLVHLLEYSNPLISTLQPQTQEKLKGMKKGCFLLKFTPEKNNVGSVLEEMLLSCWLAGVSVSMMVGKAERGSLGVRLTGKEVKVAAPEGGKAEVAVDEEPTKTEDNDDDAEK
ncbi:tRNA (cytosine(34)-C(5))-methyltransferase, partial [Chytridiales sp. JEL 0842]